MPGAPTELLPHDARRVGPPRTHVARARRPLRPAPRDPLPDPRHQPRARAQRRLHPPGRVLRPRAVRNVKDRERQRAAPAPRPRDPQR